MMMKMMACRSESKTTNSRDSAPFVDKEHVFSVSPTPKSIAEIGIHWEQTGAAVEALR